MKTSPSRVPMAEINVTPMVDVMLVLLVIFMVAGPMLEKGITVALPKMSTSQRIDRTEISIALTKDHLIYLNDRVVSVADLRRELATLSHSQPVTLRADGDAYVRRLMELWDLCRDTGFREIRIMTLVQ